MKNPTTGSASIFETYGRKGASEAFDQTDEVISEMWEGFIILISSTLAGVPLTMLVAAIARYWGLLSQLSKLANIGLFIITWYVLTLFLGWVMKRYRWVRYAITVGVAIMMFTMFMMGKN